jgi:hypothetical protein
MDRTNIHPQPVGFNPDDRTHPGYLPAWCLFVDPSYQRELVEAQVTRITGNFDEGLLGVFIISDRDGRYNLVDGQQRREALRRMERDDLLVLCKIHVGLSEREENQLFEEYNRYRSPLLAVEFFKARSARGELEEVAITKILKDIGWNLNLSRSKHVRRSGELRCVSNLRNAYMRAERMGRLDAFTDSLAIVFEAAGTNPDASRYEYIMGVFEFCLRFFKQYDRAKLVAALAPEHPMRLIQLAYPAPKGKSGRTMFIEHVTGLYNTTARPRPPLSLSIGHGAGDD